MVYVHADEKARICLTKEIVERYGQDFVIVPAKGEIILIPVSKDPIKSLQEEGKKIPKHLTIEEIRRKTAKEIEKKALERMKRRR